MYIFHLSGLYRLLYWYQAFFKIFDSKIKPIFSINILLNRCQLKFQPISHEMSVRLGYQATSVRDCYNARSSKGQPTCDTWRKSVSGSRFVFPLWVRIWIAFRIYSSIILRMDNGTIGSLALRISLKLTTGIKIY